MKMSIIPFAVVALVGIILGMLIFAATQSNFNLQAKKNAGGLPGPTSGYAASSTDMGSSTPTGTTPSLSGFHGPTGPPHIVGPQSNPPNY